METKTIRWTTGSNQNAEIKISLVLAKNINLDGDTVTVPCCEISTIGTVDGITVGCAISTNVPVKLRGLGVVALCGKLCIKMEQYTQIADAIMYFEDTPEYRKKIEIESQRRIDNADYDAHREKMRKIMGY